MPARKSHTRKNASRGSLPIVERTQALISDDPGQLLRKLASIDVSEPTMRRIPEKDLRYKSH